MKIIFCYWPFKPLTAWESVRNEDGKDNATHQRFDRLNEGKSWGTPFGAIFDLDCQMTARTFQT